jgi:hypothetical protein
LIISYQIRTIHCPSVLLDARQFSRPSALRIGVECVTRHKQPQPATPTTAENTMSPSTPAAANYSDYNMETDFEVPVYRKRQSLELRRPEVAELDDAAKRRVVAQDRRHGQLLSPDGVSCELPGYPPRRHSADQASNFKGRTSAEIQQRQVANSNAGEASSGSAADGRKVSTDSFALA